MVAMTALAIAADSEARRDLRRVVLVVRIECIHGHLADLRLRPLCRTSPYSR
jgi:hypothetical protein